MMTDDIIRVRVPVDPYRHKCRTCESAIVRHRSPIDPFPHGLSLPECAAAFEYNVE
jgi:hypothetical protein